MTKWIDELALPSTEIVPVISPLGSSPLGGAISTAVDCPGSKVPCAALRTVNPVPVTSHCDVERPLLRIIRVATPVRGITRRLALSAP